MTEDSFNSEQDKHYGKIKIELYPVENCPVPVYTDPDIPKLYDGFKIDVFHLGLYDYLQVIP